MSVFKQDLESENQMRQGGPFLIQLLFKEKQTMPDRDKIIPIFEKKMGKIESFNHENMISIATLDHIAEFKDGKIPVQFNIMNCMEAGGEAFDDFHKSQMWDCMDERDKILEECHYQIVAVDMLAAGLNYDERANLEMDFLEALMEIFPQCSAVYFQNSGKLFTAHQVKNHKLEGLDRFAYFGVNIRFFNIEGSNDMLVDTLGMNTLFLPDLQYHFHDMDPNLIVHHAYSVISYILHSYPTIEDGETIDGILNGELSQDVRWVCHYEDALIQPSRPVLDIYMGDYASGLRK